MVENVKPVNPQQHAKLRLGPTSHYHFAAKDAVCKLVALEVVKAAVALPVAFIRVEENKFAPVALQGFEPGKNLLVSPQGQWLARYKPAAYRSYPFLLGQVGNGDPIVCIDEACDSFSEEEGELLFTEDGEPAATLETISKFLGEIEANKPVTAEICNSLNKFNLIVPWNLQLNSEAGSKKIEGLYRIDEKALTELAESDFASLRSNGALPFAYAQLLSMQNIEQLVQIYRAIQKSREDIGVTLDSSSNEEMTLNFDNL